MARYEQEIFRLLDNLRRQVNTRPLILGGIEGNLGGRGGPPGGFIGQLPQNRITFDTDELSVFPIPATGVPLPSGRSLVTNLNRIRYRLDQIEASGIAVELNDSQVLGNLRVLNFEGDATVVDEGFGKATITISGGGGGGGISSVNVQKDDSLVVSSDTLNFEGNGVTVLDDGGKATITIPASGVNVYDSGFLFRSNVKDLNFSGNSLSVGAFGASGVDIESGALSIITAFQDSLSEKITVSDSAKSIVLHQPLYGYESGFGLQLNIATSGVMVQEDDVDIIRTNTINFEGGVTVTENSGVVTVLVSGAGGGESTQHIYNEDMSPQFGGTTFNTNFIYASGTLRVYYNGLRQAPTAYTENSLSGQFTVTFTPSGVDTLYVDYDYLTSEQPEGWGQILWDSGDWGG